MYKPLIVAACLAAMPVAFGDDAPLSERAAKALAGGEYAAAAALYKQLVAADPSDVRSLFSYASALRQSGDLALADEALSEAARLGAPPSFVAFERAALRATGQRRDEALEQIEQAVAAGYQNVEALREEPAFSQLADDERFVAALERAEANRAPCLADEAFRAFDFWLGEWQVHDARDNYAGINRITREEGGCYVLERWTGASGSTGMSVNFYDAASEEWVQQWISQNGMQIHIRGGLVDDSMILTGDIFYVSSGLKADFRGTWTPLADGRVRQFFEQSVDGGENWSAWFEGFYTRVDADSDDG